MINWSITEAKRSKVKEHRSKSDIMGVVLKSSIDNTITQEILKGTLS